MRIVRSILLAFNALALLALWVMSLAQNVPPQSSSLAAVLCFAFPICVVANLFFVVVWLAVRWYYAIGAALGVLFCIQGIYTYCPFFGGGRVEDSDDVLKVISFNTHSWGMGNAEWRNGVNSLVQWVIDERPHAVLMQEAQLDNRHIQPLRDAGYTVLHPGGIKSASIATRLPVVDYTTLDMPTLDHNGAMEARVVWQGDTLTLVSLHFESYHLREADKGNYRNLITRPVSGSAQRHGRTLFGKMRPVLAQHGVQADWMACYVENELKTGHNMVLGGDFNDLPNSYACGRIRSLLSDCYRSAGRGVGFTYDADFMHFRIDHLFCSPSLEAISTVVADSVCGSDHKPLITWVRKRK